MLEERDLDLVRCGRWMTLYLGLVFQVTLNIALHHHVIKLWLVHVIRLFESYKNALTQLKIIHLKLDISPSGGVYIHAIIRSKDGECIL